MSDFTRRDFHRLAVAAIGGMAVAAAVKGTLAGDDKKDDKHGCSGPNGCNGKGTKQEAHVCRGLNSCKGNGGCGATKGKNECAGTGGCATVASHGCAGHNSCKGQGGCGTTAGMNECKGKGECAVPLKAEDWKTCRAKFEDKMKKAGKKVGPAPEAMKK